MKISNSGRWQRLFIYALILMVMIFTIRFLQSEGSVTNNIFIPVGFIAIFISFYLFREYNRVQRAKRDERREHLNERRQELLDNVVKKKKENNDRD